MKTLSLAALGFALLLAAAGPASGIGLVQSPSVLLRFSSMVGVQGPFVGEDNPIRDIPGDGLPWVVKRVEGFVTTRGQVTIVVRGLVFPDDPSVPPELRGKNDEDEFRAIVSCLVDDGTGHVVPANVATPGFPASTSGNAFISAKIDLPKPCFAPIVFIVAGDEDDWLAVTGVDARP